MKTLSKNEMRTAVESLIANGAVVKNYAKFARIQAIEAVGGEVIETILADGTKETSNTANAGDWIVTNPGGEKYIVPAAKFPKKYEAAPEIGDGWFKPTGGVQKFLELDEDTKFICSWDEEQFIAKGDHGDRHPVCREYGEFQAGGKPWPHLLHNDRHEQWQG